MYDLLIQNANIVDGTGAPPFRGCVGVKDGLIAFVGAEECGAKETLDAQELTLMPGFVDIHSHSDATALDCPENESRILQGITSEIAGNCGSSFKPSGPDETGVAEFLERLGEAGCSTNVGMLVGHGTLRAQVVGYSDEPAAPGQLARMRELAAKAMREGAFGLSSGLIYAPGCYADTDELVAVASAIRPYGGFYATHMRGEGAGVVRSVREAIETAARADVPLQISHHKVTYKPDWQKSCFETTALIERARREGIDVSCDQYPYRASATTLSINIPAWGFNGGIPALMERLGDPSIRQKLRDECSRKHEGRWGDIYVSYVTSQRNAWMPGLSISEIAARLGGKDPAETLFDIVVEENDGVGEICYGMCEEDIEHIMRQPFTMAGTDGSAMALGCAGKPHPRNFGAFVRLLAHYCRDRELFPLETAVRKLTSLPAGKAGLRERGAIRLGARADLVLADMDALADTPTFAQPQAACAGIERVYVNGVLSAREGRHTGAAAGMILRGPGYGVRS